MIYEGKAITVSMIEDGIAELKFDLQGESVNKFDRVTLDDLKASVAAIAVGTGRSSMALKIWLDSSAQLAMSSSLPLKAAPNSMMSAPTMNTALPEETRTPFTSLLPEMAATAALRSSSVTRQTGHHAWLRWYRSSATRHRCRQRHRMDLHGQRKPSWAGLQWR